MSQHEVSFQRTDAEDALIKQIAARAVAFAAQHGKDVDESTMQMDICACHANGCPLRLDDLLAAEDFNFIHDAFGIHNCIDRSTGKLTNHFLPRFAAPQASQDEDQ